jgi:hypothetical protein
MSWKGWPQKKRLKPKRRIITGPGRLALREKDRPIVSIEEIRRKGLIMASQGFGRHTATTSIQDKKGSRVLIKRLSQCITTAGEPTSEPWTSADKGEE